MKLIVDHQVQKYFLGFENSISKSMFYIIVRLFVADAIITTKN